MTAKEAIESKCRETQTEINRLQIVLRAYEAKHKGFKDALFLVNGHNADAYYVRKLEDKILKEEEDAQETRQKIEEAKATLEAFEETKKLLGKGIDEQSSPELRAGSELHQMREAIRQKGSAMTISELLIVLGKEDTTETKNSLRGSIGRYAKDDRIFVKTATNTFGLVELGHKPESSATKGGDNVT